MGERNFDTPNLGSDLWPMGFDVDLALDTSSGRKVKTCTNAVGISTSSPVENGNVNISYGDMQHMLLHRFDDDLNEGDICQITDLTHTLPKTDAESAHGLLAKIACQELPTQGQVQKAIEASLFATVTNGSTPTSSKPSLQPVDVYGRVSLFDGKLVLQLKHFNTNSNYPVSIGECWLCREKLISNSQIHSHKHVLQGLFQVNNEFVQMDIDHYIIPDQALEPDPAEVNRNINPDIITSSGPTHMNSEPNSRHLSLDSVACPDGLQRQTETLNNIGNPIYSSHSIVSNVNAETLRNESQIHYSATDLNHTMNTSQAPLSSSDLNHTMNTSQTPLSSSDLNHTMNTSQAPLSSDLSHTMNTSQAPLSSSDLSHTMNTPQSSINSSITMDSGGFLNTFAGNQSRIGKVLPSIVQSSKEPTVINQNNSSASSLAFSACTRGPDANGETLADHHSKLKEIESIPSLSVPSDPLSRTDTLNRHNTFDPTIPNKEHLDNYNNFFGGPYTYPPCDDSGFHNQLVKIPNETPPQQSDKFYDLTSATENVRKRAEVGAKKRKSRTQRKASCIKMKDENQTVDISVSEAKEGLSDNSKFILHTSVDGHKPINSDSGNVDLKVINRDKSKINSNVNSLNVNSPLNVFKKDFSVGCPVCKQEFTFKTLSEFRIHIRSHDLAETYIYSCPICSKKMSNTLKYVQHLKMHNGKRYSCSQCDAHYSRLDKLKSHVVNVHDKKRPFKCHICSKTFKRNDYLKSHMDIHNGKKFECDICHKFYKSQCNLRLHKRLHSNERFPHQCNQCDKSYLRKDLLRLHISRDHKNERFKCDICLKSFSRSDVLRRHKETHDDKRVLYNCDICNKKFFRKDSLKAHSYEHKYLESKCKNKKAASRIKSKNSILLKQFKHKVEKRKDRCTICPKDLPPSEKLGKHLQWHEFHVDNNCNKNKEQNNDNESYPKLPKTKILTKTKESYHVQSQDVGSSVKEKTKESRVSERKFTCDICSKAFTRSYNLKIHMKAHSKKTSDDDDMLAELPTVLSASKTMSLKKKKKSYLSLAKNTSEHMNYSALELITYASCSNSTLDNPSTKDLSSNVPNLQIPLESTLGQSPSSGQLPPPLPSELPMSSSSFCTSSPTSPINLSTEAISAAAYLLAHPFYEGPY